MLFISPNLVIIFCVSPYLIIFIVCNTLYKIQMIWSSKGRVSFSDRQIGLLWSHPQPMRTEGGYSFHMTQSTFAAWKRIFFPQPWETVGDPSLFFSSALSSNTASLSTKLQNELKCCKKDAGCMLDTSLFLCWVCCPNTTRFRKISFCTLAAWGLGPQSHLHS